MKKAFSIIGILVGIAFILVGIMSMSGAFSGSSTYPDGSFLFDSGYAEFGADYYTYSVNNTAEAAEAARAAAYNVIDVTDFLASFCGIFSILFGILVICAFGVVLGCCNKETVTATTNADEAPEAYAEEAPAEEAPAEEAPSEEPAEEQ